MSVLNVEPNFDDADAFYAALIDAHRGLSDEQSTALNARLVLLLANHIGDGCGVARRVGEGAPIGRRGERDMKLASLKHGRDGALVVVSQDLSRAVVAAEIAPTLQAALDAWKETAPKLQALSAALNEGRCANAFAFDEGAVVRHCHARISGPTAARTSITSNWCDARAARRCRSRSGPNR